MIMIKIMLTRNDIKYSLIRPFWLVVRVVMLVWMVEVDFGIKFSSQIKSNKVRDVLRLVLSDFIGMIRCMIGGK